MPQSTNTMATYLAILILSFLVLLVQAGPASCQRPQQGSGRTPSIGTVNATLIFIDFPDAKHNETVEEAMRDVSLSDTMDFFKESSFGIFNLNISMPSTTWYRMKSPSYSYNYNLNLSMETHQKLAQDALEAVGTNVSFKETQLLIIAAARTATIIGSISATGFFSPVAADGTIMSNVINISVDFYAASTSKSSIGLTTAFAMGIRGQCPPSIGVDAGDAYLGGYSPMCDATPLAPDYLARQKWALGWLDEMTEVTCVGTDNGSTLSLPFNKNLTLTAVESNTTSSTNSSAPQTKLAILPLPGTKSLYVEARTKSGADADACLSGSGAGGVLLYLADSSGLDGPSDPVQIVDLQPHSVPTGCGSERQGYLDLLGLSGKDQVTSYLVPNTGVRIRVLSENSDLDEFVIIFESGISEESLETPSVTSVIATATKSTLPSALSTSPALPTGQGSVGSRCWDINPWSAVIIIFFTIAASVW